VGECHNRLSARVLIWTFHDVMRILSTIENSHNRLSARVLIWTVSNAEHAHTHTVSHNRLSARVLIWTSGARTSITTTTTVTIACRLES